MDIDEIATRRPNDDPGAGEFHYCLNRLDGAIVDKTHIPYDLSPRKLARIRQLFLEPNWEVKNLPGYSDELAANPFATFADIPVRARYQFLLDDAEYEVGTFIKGPVCNGSIAVNSIQAQFLVPFLSPDADSMVMSAVHARAAEPLLILPGIWGSDVQFSDDIPFLRASSNSAKRIESSGRTTPVSAPIGAPASANPRLPSQKPETSSLDLESEFGRAGRDGLEVAREACGARHGDNP